MRGSRACVGGTAALSILAAPAPAQEAIFTPAATSPAKGRLSLRTQARYTRYENDPTPLGRTADEVTLWTRLTYGVTGTLSIDADLPVIARSVERAGLGDEEAWGLGDVRLGVKWRVWQSHSGAIDTARVALLGGVELPTGTGDLSSHSVDPFVGGVLTIVRGRHGFNQSLAYQFNTGTDAAPLAPNAGEDDALLYDSAYLFRLAPAAYTDKSTRSWYATLELNGIYETGGDNEILLSPGILLEARTFALEAAVRLPVHQELDGRPERELGIVFGLRWLF